MKITITKRRLFRVDIDGEYATMLNHDEVLGMVATAMHQQASPNLYRYGLADEKTHRARARERRKRFGK